MHIVYTRHDGGVSVCTPTPQCIAWLCSGGLWASARLGFVDEQIAALIAEGRDERAVVRYCRAIVSGGCTTAEALEIIRDRDCGHLGTGHELWDTADIPRDRWFRNAWHRSANGGPIVIDMGAARRIQFAKIKTAAAAEEQRRRADIELFDRPVELPWGALRDRIHAASDALELRRVWPKELN